VQNSWNRLCVRLQQPWWILLVCLSACGTSPVVAVPAQGHLTVAEGMAQPATTGYLRAEQTRPFVFPADHGPHPDYAVEWWYYTGNLHATNGQRYGYQYTLFRTGLPRTATESDTAWQTDAVYMAHFTVTDVDAQTFVARERFNRAALGLAGAQAVPFRVWMDDWVVAAPDASGTQMHIQVADGDIALDLTLDARGPTVLQGDAGLSRKSAELGNASYYYSMPRMNSTGTLRIGDQTTAVTGLSWMDREWSTSALGPNHVGWDWFALHLDDGSDIMLYQLRNRDGAADAFSGGSVRSSDGTVTILHAADIRWQPHGTWVSPHSNGRYPAAWQIAITPLALDVTVTPVVPDQELQVTVRYWEGAVDVTGTRRGVAVRGEGYLEMTGYADER